MSTPFQTPLRIEGASGRSLVIGDDCELVAEVYACTPAELTEIVRRVNNYDALRAAVDEVLNGTVCPWGRMDDGMMKGHVDPAFVKLWQKKLQTALEQKP